MYSIDFMSITCSTIIHETKYFRERLCGLEFLILTIRLFAIEVLSKLKIKNTQMCKHHYLSFIVILIVVIIIIIFSFIKEDNDDYFSKLAVMILPELLFSITYVWGAKYLSIIKGNIYKLLFINGVIWIFLSALLQVFTHSRIECDSIKNFFYDLKYYCNKDKLKTIIGNFHDFKNFGVFMSIFNILIHFVEIWIICLLIFSFSVNHFGAICTIPFFVYLIKCEKETGLFIPCIVGGIIIFLLSWLLFIMKLLF